MQADTVLEKELRVPLLDLLIAGRGSNTGSDMNISNINAHLHLVTHFLQQGYTYFNKVTPPNNAMHYEPVYGSHFHSKHHAIALLI